MVSSRALVWTTLAYVAFVAYGSLLPFEFTPRPPRHGVDAFLAIPWLPLGPLDRADWIANLILYVPLGFLLSGAISDHGDRDGTRVWRVVLAVAIGLAIAVAIEFLQTWFPPRTVSLNDLAAEALGLACGAFLWVSRGPSVLATVMAAVHGGGPSLRALSTLYVGAYICLALFPFDVLVSMEEVRGKVSGPLVGILTAPASCVLGRSPLCLLKVCAEAAAALALGYALRVLAAGVQPTAWARAAAIGVGLGVGIELLQLFIGSGVADGRGALVRTIAITLGYRFGRGIGVHAARVLGQPWLRVGAAVALVAYLIALLGLHGWFSGALRTAATVAAQLDHLNFLPFYYHYFTTESRAVSSALVQAALYAPFGGLRWLAASAGRRADARTAWLAAALGGAAAVLVGTGKLIFLGKRPDPTDVIIGAAAAGLACFALSRLVATEAHSASSPALSAGESPGRSAAPAGWPRLPLISALFLAAAAALLWRFPVAPLALAAAFALYFCLLIRYPASWIVAVTALLPTLDMIPWTGWLAVNESDLLLLVTLAAMPWRRMEPAQSSWPPIARLLLVLFACSTLVGVLLGLLPLQPLTADALSTYHTPFNALRVGRGVLWALLILAIAGRTPRAREGFAAGMVIGLLIVGVVVAWEAVAFLGPFRFSEDYRVSGPFSAMSTAGAQLESYVAAASPFAALWVVRGAWPQRLAGVAALAAAAYTIAATVSRAGYAAEIASMAVFLAALAVASVRSGRRRALAGGVAAVLLLGVIGYAASHGSAASSRLKAVQGDFAARFVHWRGVIDLMDRDWSTKLFGMGIGSYPRTFLLHAPAAERPSVFSYRRDDSASFVRLGAGRAVYLEQIVGALPNERYAFEVRVRAVDRPGVLRGLVCEKWVLYGAECFDFTAEVPAGGGWTSTGLTLQSGDLGKGPFPFRRPIKVTVVNAGSSALDVTGVSLIDATSRDLVENGSFARGGDRWYFSADDHFPWNVFNLFVELFFEQGWVGLTLFAALLAYALANLAIGMLRGDLMAGTFLAALAGFFVPALFDSVIDEPRMRALLLLLIVVPILDQFTPRRKASRVQSLTH